MKQTKLLLILCIFLVLVSGVNALPSLRNQLISYWDFNEPSGNVTDKVTGLIASPSGTVGVMPGISNNSRNVSAAHSNIITQPLGRMYNLSNGYTFNMWIRLLSGCSSACHAVFGYSIPNGNPGFEIVLDISKRTWLYPKGDIFVIFYSPTVSTPQQQWIMITNAFNGTHYLAYYNGVLQSAVASDDKPYLNNRQYWLLYTEGGTSIAIDEFMFWNRSLTQEEINWLLNNPTNYSSLIGELSFINQTPVNKTQYNYTNINYIINFKNNPSNSSGLFVQCSLRINNNVITIINGTFNGTGQLNYTYDIGNSSTIYYNWTCINGNGHNFTSPTHLVYTDIIQPTIQTNFINNSVFMNNLTAQFNFSDDFSLFMHNISIDGSVISSVYLNGTVNFSQVNLSRNIFNLSVGKHNLTALVCDGHTAKEIEDYSISKGIFGDILEFNTGKNNIKIYAKDKSLFDKWGAKKEIDRYTFTYEPYDKQKTKNEFYVETEQEIYILSNDKLPYKKWIVSGNNWIDFYIENENYDIEITKESNKKALVKLNNLVKKDKLEFKSIGNLNCYSLTYDFYKANITISNTTTQTETTYVNYTVSINTYIDSNISASLIFNGTKNLNYSGNSTNRVYYSYFMLPLINQTQEILNGTWTITINNLQENFTFNQTINRIILALCNTTFNQTTLNFTLRDENTNNLVAGTYNSFFTVWLSDVAYNRTFGFNQSNVNNFSVCVNVNNTLNTNYIITYSATGYSIRNYYEFNQPINRTVRNLILYLLNSSASTVKVRAIDQLESPLQGYLLEMYRLNELNNTFFEVASGLTDYNGYYLFSYISTNKYKFVIKNQSGYQIFDSGELYITTSPLILKIATIGSNTMYYDLSLLNIDYTLYNISRLVNFTWFNKKGLNNTLCLRITKGSILNETNVYTACSANSTGTITYNITEDGEYMAYAYAIGSVYPLSILRLSFTNVTKLFNLIGKTGLFLTMILVLLMGFAFGWNPALIGIFAIVGLFASMLLELIPFNYSILALLLTIAIIIAYKVRT